MIKPPRREKHLFIALGMKACYAGFIQAANAPKAIVKADFLMLDELLSHPLQPFPARAMFQAFSAFSEMFILELDKFFLCHGKNCFNGLIHIIVFVFTESTTENNVLFCICKLPIFDVQFAVFPVVNGIIGFITGFPFGGVLS